MIHPEDTKEYAPSRHLSQCPKPPDARDKLVAVPSPITSAAQLLLKLTISA
ncbi:MAG: hypothetical protein KME60_33105 [Cyanomargarita calcarea GSE-NOS-MK-12-04C]|uniref:Uncharacterized protein n=1 Tax=Cyanomargarita calcarea GSE-NOS-MK-12-04C TaxID=2839659 RepID=A0A951QUS4_9CYAN|nr:hypothetical protein [Cyanomargarita calcarea GSE-NOS-MK-12-04C]